MSGAEQNAEQTSTGWKVTRRNGVSRGAKVQDVIASGLLPTPTLGGFDDTNARALRKKQLHVVVHHALLPTPTTGDRRSRNCRQQGINNTIEDGRDGKKTGLRLQPSFALWMMGYPKEWLDLEDGEMPLSGERATRSSRK